MPGTIVFGALTTIATAMYSDGTSPSLVSLANDARQISDEIDNSTNRYTHIALDLYIRASASPSAVPYVSIWFVNTVDATNYEDGSTSVTPARNPDVNILLRSITTQQRLSVIVPFYCPLKFKILLLNKVGVALTATSNENILKYRLFGHQIT